MKIDILKLINISKKINIFWAGALIIFITSCGSNGKDDGKSFIFELEEGDPINASPPLSSQIAGSSLISLVDSSKISESEIAGLKFDDIYISEEQYFSKLKIDKSSTQAHKQNIGEIFGKVKPADDLDKYAESFVGGVIRVFAADYSRDLAKVYKGSRDSAISQSYFSVGGIHNSEFSARVMIPASGRCYVVFYLMDYITTVDQILTKYPNFSVDPKVGLSVKDAARKLGDSFKPGHVGTSSVVDFAIGNLGSIKVTVQRSNDIFAKKTFTAAKKIIPLMSHSEARGSIKFSNFAIDKNDKRYMIGYSINLSEIAKEQGNNPFVFTATKNAEGKFEWPYGYIEISSVVRTVGIGAMNKITTKYNDRGVPLKYQNVKWNSGANANAYSTWKCVVRTAYDGEETIWDISSTPRTMQGSANSVCDGVSPYGSVHQGIRKWRNPDRVDVNDLALGDLEHKMNYFLPTTAISIRDYDNHAGVAVYELSSINHTLEKVVNQSAEKFIYIADFNE
ncbi:MAG: hypothetical protein JJV97_05815 [SAR324 cluster bacterium]|nr:hypothetical protein [SAR324 cluster bacterium]